MTVRAELESVRGVVREILTWSPGISYEELNVHVWEMEGLKVHWEGNVAVFALDFKKDFKPVGRLSRIEVINRMKRKLEEESRKVKSGKVLERMEGFRESVSR